MTFDSTLPGVHSYLGTDMEDVRGRTVLQESEVVILPILSFPGVVLVPGQTLPLQVFQPQVVALLRRLIDQDGTFGCVARLTSPDPEEAPYMSHTGTTAEIYSMKEEADERSGIVTLAALARGRQRFRIKDTRVSGTGILLARAEILSDWQEPDPVHTLQLASDPTSSLRRCKSSHRNTWILTAHPHFVYRQYDTARLTAELRQLMVQWDMPQACSSECDLSASDFSFRVLGVVPLPAYIRLYVLRLDSVVQRLRCLVALLRECTELHCSDPRCDAPITSKDQVFCMSSEGPMSNYVNPGGYVHETLTVFGAHNLTLRGPSSAEHSWFPGYKWTIVECASCNRHMGWKFKSTKSSLKPSKFWGLTRSALVPHISLSEADLEKPPI